MYSTVDNLRRRVRSGVLDGLIRDPASGEPDETRAITALVNAGAVVDGYLGRCYQVPIHPAPPLLAKLTEDLALYEIMAGRGFDEGDAVVERQAKLARDLLVDIATGKAELSGVSQPPAARPEAGAVCVVSRKPHYTDRFFERF